MPDVGEPSDEREGASGAGPTDPDGWVRELYRPWSEAGVVERDALALVGDDVAGAEPGDDLEGVLEEVETFSRRRERDPELVVLLLEPGCSQGQLEPSVRSVVDRHRLCREDRRMPVGGTR